MYIQRLLEKESKPIILLISQNTLGDLIIYMDNIFCTMGDQSELPRPNEDQTRVCIRMNYCVEICIKFVHFVRASAEELYVLINRSFS